MVTCLCSATAVLATNSVTAAAKTLSRNIHIVEYLHRCVRGRGGALASRSHCRTSANAVPPSTASTGQAAPARVSPPAIPPATPRRLDRPRNSPRASTSATMRRRGLDLDQLAASATARWTDLLATPPLARRMPRRPAPTARLAPARSRRLDAHDSAPPRGTGGSPDGDRAPPISRVGTDSSSIFRPSEGQEAG